MAILGVDDFKSKLTGGGARANLFKATLNFPGYAGANVELASFMCKAAQLPASIIAPITIPFRGRQLQIAGDRTFEPWSVTIINDVQMETRNAFERWMNGINQHNANTGLTNPVDYQADMIVEQLNKDDSVLARYEFFNMFPKNIGEITLGYDTVDAVEEFTVDLTFSHWERVL